jgi:hypothetical protein
MSNFPRAPLHPPPRPTPHPPPPPPHPPTPHPPCHLPTHPQAFIYKYVPIIGPIVGSAFVLGLYILARLLRGDLTDRLKMMDSEVGGPWGWGLGGRGAGVRRGPGRAVWRVEEEPAAAEAAGGLHKAWLAPRSSPPTPPPPIKRPPPHPECQQEEKRRRTALREARIAFLEEEVPALVARGAGMGALRKKMAEVNKKLGDKFDISDSELQGTYDACRQLMEAGEVGGAGILGGPVLAPARALGAGEGRESGPGGGGGGRAAAAGAGPPPAPGRGRPRPALAASCGSFRASRSPSLNTGRPNGRGVRAGRAGRGRGSPPRPRGAPPGRGKPPTSAPGTAGDRSLPHQPPPRTALRHAPRAVADCRSPLPPPRLTPPPPSLLPTSQDLDSGKGASQAAERILAEQEATEKQDAGGERRALWGRARGTRACTSPLPISPPHSASAHASTLSLIPAAEGGEGGGQGGGDALMEMGKLNTARIRKAVDPKVLDVKKRVRWALVLPGLLVWGERTVAAEGAARRGGDRHTHRPKLKPAPHPAPPRPPHKVRAARRSLKRESKVQLSDEIIFFDDVAGNDQVGGGRARQWAGPAGESPAQAGLAAVGRVQPLSDCGAPLAAPSRPPTHHR